MAETRPSGLPVIPDEEAVVTQEVAVIDARGRLKLLPRWTRRVAWLRPAADVDALMLLGHSGRISLLEWERAGKPVVDRHADLLASGEIDLEALRQIQDRYRRLPLNQERRPYLGDAALAHLGFDIGRGTRRTVYVAVYPDRIDLLSPSYRDSQLLESHPLLDGLAE